VIKDSKVRRSRSIFMITPQHTGFRSLLPQAAQFIIISLGTAVMLYASSGSPSWWYYLIGGLWVVYAAVLRWRVRRVTARPLPPGLCPNCGYDLRATPDRCPECGALPAGAKA
jgi:hypothetical protein